MNSRIRRTVLLENDNTRDIIIPVPKMGTVIASVIDKDTLYVDVASSQYSKHDGITYKNNKYTGHLYFNRSGAGFSFDQRRIDTIKVITGPWETRPATDLARKAVMYAIIAAVNAWTDSNDMLFYSAEQRNIQNEIKSLNRDKAEHQKAILEIDSKIAELTRKLK